LVSQKSKTAITNVVVVMSFIHSCLRGFEPFSYIFSRNARCILNVNPTLAYLQSGEDMLTALNKEETNCYLIIIRQLLLK